MIIYRVEDGRGHGPYNGWHAIADELFLAHKADDDGLSQLDTHPSPLEDIPNFKKTDEYQYGFANESALRSWFGPRAIEVLELEGFGISLYEVDEKHVRKGYHQLAYVKKNSKLIERRPLTTS